MAHFLLVLISLFCFPALVWSEENTFPQSSSQDFMDTGSFKSFFEEELLVENKSTSHPQILQFIDKLVVKHRDLSRERLIDLFNQVKLDDPLRKRLSNQLRRPAEKTKSWESYRGQFLNKKKINTGMTFYRKHQDLLKAVSEKFSVPMSIILATLGVESNYGKANYPYPVFHSLIMNGFINNYRSQFYLAQLEFFILWAHENRHTDEHILAVKGSYSGAMGPAQFIPRSIHHYGYDFDQDGRVDMLHNYKDILASIAYYYRKNGWKKGKKIITDLPPPCETKKDVLILTDTQNRKRCWKKEHNYRVILTYNHNDYYAQVIYLLASAFDAEIAEIDKGE